MEVVRNGAETATGPTERFTGKVYIDRVAIPTRESRLSALSVHFAPGGRTAWHTHLYGQTIWVTEGLGVIQLRGGPIEVIHSGDRVFFQPGEDHWHGAAPHQFMTHLAIQQVDDQDNEAQWGMPVSDTEYARAREILHPEA